MTTGIEAIHSKVLQVISRLRIRADRMLDIGCGNGEFTVKIAKLVQAKEVYGVDIDEKALLEAERRGIHTLKIDIYKERLPFSSNYFDLCTAIEVIEHIPHGDNMIAEIHRVLKHDGLLIITTPNLASIINRLLLFFGYQPMHSVLPSLFYRIGLPGRPKKRTLKTSDSMPAPYATHISAYTLKGLKDLLEVYGFKVIKAIGVTLPSSSKLRDLIAKPFQRIPSLADDIIVIAKKVDMQCTME